MAEWDRVRLEELAAQEKSSISKPFGSAILASDYRQSGVPVVRGVNLADGVFRDQDFAYIDASLASKMPGAQMRSGDLVVTHRGSVGQVSMIPRRARYETYVASTSHVKVRLDANRAVPEFVYYWFQSAAGRASILEHLSTVGVPGLVQPVATVKGLRVPAPPMDVQRAIAAVLGALDEKIASNRRVVAATDELRVATWERIVGRSRNQVPLSSLARFVNGKAFTKNATGNGRVVIRIAELNSGIGGSTIWNDIDVDSDNVAEPGSYLMAWSGSLTARRWFRDEAIVNQHIFKVIPSGGNPLWGVACAVESQLPFFKSIAAGKATTMGHIQRRHLDEPVRWPAELLSPGEHMRGQSLWDRALAAERESETLARTRDELLPLLMSGKITVKQAEAKAEKVL